MLRTSAALAAASTLATAVLVASAGSAAAGPDDPTLYVLSGSTVARVDPGGNGMEVVGSRDITGLAAGEEPLAIDVRPATGELLLLASPGRLYRLDPVTGAATAAGPAFSPALEGDRVGFDVNPVADLVRVVTAAGQDLRVSPGTGQVVGVDGRLAYAEGDPGAGTAPQVAASGYTESWSGPATTRLYGIDAARDVLVVQDPPNAGVLRTVGPLGVPTGTEFLGLDVTPDGRAFAALSPGGVPGLFRVDLGRGTATPVRVAGGFPAPDDVAVAVEPPDAVALLNGNALVRFPLSAPEQAASPVPVVGLPAPRVLVAIDVRPADGTLYGLDDGGNLHRIGADGRATRVGSLPVLDPASGTPVGFDVNPVVDRLRIVTADGRNLRVDLDTGAVTADGGLSFGEGAAPRVVGAAYTNAFAGATGTRLYDIDAERDVLAVQDPPNAGTLTAVGPLGVDVDDVTGFDVGRGDVAHAVVPSAFAGQRTLVRVDLATGRADAVGELEGDVRGLAVLPYRACPAGEVPASGFEDVERGDVHAGAIDCVVWYDVAKGTSATTFAPGAALTRGQLASLVARAVETSGLNLPAMPADAFSDDAGVHEAAVNKLAAIGVVRGSGGVFGGGAPVSRAQAAALVVRAHDAVLTAEPLVATANAFTDDEGAPLEPEIDKAARAGFARGVAPGRFAPDGTVTRAQAASFTARLLERFAAQGELTQPAY